MLRQSYRIKGSGDPCKQVTALLVATGLAQTWGASCQVPPPQSWLCLPGPALTAWSLLTCFISRNRGRGWRDRSIILHSWMLTHICQSSTEIHVEMHEPYLLPPSTQQWQTVPFPTGWTKMDSCQPMSFSPSTAPPPATALLPLSPRASPLSRVPHPVPLHMHWLALFSHLFLLKKR